MIRLIAADIDGTLVPEGTSKINPEYFEVIKALKAKGVTFAAASGRGFSSARTVFQSIARDVYFMVENGGYILEGDREVYKSCFEHSLICEIVKYGRKIPGTFMLLSSAGCSHTDSKDQAFIDRFEKGYGLNFDRVEDLLDVNVPIFKAAMYNGQMDAAEFVKPARQFFAGSLTAFASGTHWVDFVPLGVDKGEGLKELQKILGVSRGETIAFGDNLNDIPMLKAAGTGYAVEEARPEVKEAADRMAGSMRQDGVLQVLKTLL